jgi:hypothetical protein
MSRVECPHWSESAGVAKSHGHCALQLYGGRPSFGVCSRCEHNAAYVEPPPRLRADVNAEIPLAGDLLESAIKRIGADRLAKWWEKATGRPCGCKERREKMNQATRRLLAWLGRNKDN